MLILIDLTKKMFWKKRAFVMKQQYFFLTGDIVAGKIHVRIVLHPCNLRTSFFSTFCWAAELKSSLELKLVPSKLEICLEHTIGVFQDMNN